MKKLNSSPTMGQIVRAWWPDHLDRTKPGPKLRPVIFLGEAQKGGTLHWVVAYGTTQCSQEKERRNGGDLYVTCRDNSSMVLQSDTRFDFNQIQAIPATPEFFCADKVSGEVKSLDLPAHLFPTAVECMKFANVAKTLKLLGVLL